MSSPPPMAKHQINAAAAAAIFQPASRETLISDERLIAPGREAIVAEVQAIRSAPSEDLVLYTSRAAAIRIGMKGR